MSTSWEQAEAEWQAHPIKVRLQGYMLACTRAAATEENALQASVDEMERARRAAEGHRDQANWWCEQGELVAKVIASEDEAWMSEVAAHLEELFG